jgi:hypothetical protein
VTLPLNKEMLEAAYELARTTPPFKSWNLPDGEDISFRVTRDPFRRGHYRKDKHGRHEIAVSALSIGYTHNLFETVCHEAIHLHQEISGMANGAEHNASFRKLAAGVCKFHGFDPKLFY